MKIALHLGIAPSPYHGLDMDHGFLTQVFAGHSGPKISEVIRHYGQNNRIFAVCMRNVRRPNDGVAEFFLDEDIVDTLRALQAYHDCGFYGPLCPIPSSDMSNDTE